MVPRNTRGVRFQVCWGPLSPDALKLPLFDWEPGRGRENTREIETGEEESEAFSLE